MAKKWPEIVIKLPNSKVVSFESKQSISWHVPMYSKSLKCALRVGSKAKKPSSKLKISWTENVQGHIPNTYSLSLPNWVYPCCFLTPVWNVKQHQCTFYAQIRSQDKVETTYFQSLIISFVHGLRTPNEDIHLSLRNADSHHMVSTCALSE